MATSKRIHLFQTIILGIQCWFSGAVYVIIHLFHIVSGCFQAIFKGGFPCTFTTRISWKHEGTPSPTKASRPASATPGVLDQLDRCSDLRLVEHLAKCRWGFHEDLCWTNSCRSYILNLKIVYRLEELNFPMF